MQEPFIPFPNIPFLDLSTITTTQTLIYILFVFGFFYLINTGVLFYHWVSYGMGNYGIYVAEILFVSVSAMFFVIAFLSASYF